MTTTTTTTKTVFLNVTNSLGERVNLAITADTTGTQMANMAGLVSFTKPCFTFGESVIGEISVTMHKGNEFPASKLCHRIEYVDYHGVKLYRTLNSVHGYKAFINKEDATLHVMRLLIHEYAALAETKEEADDETIL